MKNQALVLLLVAAGCPSAPLSEPPGDPGVRLSVAWSPEIELAGFAVEAVRVACVDEITVKEERFVAQLGVEGAGASEEVFVPLSAGCWDLSALPIVSYQSTSFEPSAECSAASSPLPVHVGEALNTTVRLQSHCLGDQGSSSAERGYDTPPALASLEAEGDECDIVRVCGIATDEEDDLIEFEWDSVGGAPPYRITPLAPELLGADDGRREWRLCADIEPAGVSDQRYELTIYDLALEDGDPVRWEELVGARSRAAAQWTAGAGQRSCED